MKEEQQGENDSTKRWRKDHRLLHSINLSVWSKYFCTCINLTSLFIIKEWTKIEQNSASNRSIDLVVRVFAKGPGDRGSIPDQVIPKTKKWNLMPPCLTLSVISYGSRVKWSNPKKGVAPFPTPRCSSYLGPPRLGSPTLFLLMYEIGVLWNSRGISVHAFEFS